MVVEKLDQYDPAHVAMAPVISANRPNKFVMKDHLEDGKQDYEE